MNSRVCKYRLVAWGPGWREATGPIVIRPQRTDALAGNASASTLHVQGRFIYNLDGSEHGIRRAKVEIRSSGFISSSVIAADATDDDGSFDVAIDSSQAGADTTIFARMYSEDRSSGGGSVITTVVDNGLILKPTFYADSASQKLRSGSTTVTLLKTNVDSGGQNTPFYIYDSIVEGYLIATEVLQRSPSVPVKVYYPTRGALGIIDDTDAHYSGNEISIGKQYTSDRDVILHEYGHFIADQNGFTQTQGGCHSIPFGHVNVSLAWGEGWASFFSVAGQRERGKQDTVMDSFNPSNHYHYNLEDGKFTDGKPAILSGTLQACGTLLTPPITISGGAGYDNEGSVQFILWDLYDGLEDTLSNAGNAKDKVNLGFRAVFEVARGPATPTSGQTNVDRLERFYSSLFRNNAAALSQQQDISNLFREQDIQWPVPGAAPSNLRNTATSGVPVLAWDGDPPSGGQWEILRSTDASFLSFLLPLVDRTSSNSYRDGSAPANATLFYTVRSRLLFSATEQNTLNSEFSNVLRTSVGSGGSEPPQPTPIGIGQIVSGSLSASSPFRSGRCSGCFADQYQLSLDSSQSLAISMDSSAFDAYLRILDSSGKQVASDDNSGGNGNARITIALPPGKYVLEAASFAPGVSGGYTLAVALTGGQAPPAARRINVGDAVNGNLTSASGRSQNCAGCYADVYQLSVSSGQSLTIDLKSASFDAYLRVYDSS
jgi:hypothetical protein